ncbi:MAG TPA: hypothetical protein VMV05_10330, partial [bacterium]|nr:hypothetical protein [bacterium]
MRKVFLQKNRQLLFILAASFFASFLTMKVQAGEGLFSRTYTTETVPGGHWELEQAVRYRFDRAFGSYSAFDFITEAEYGISDNLQAALYVKTGAIEAED